MTDPIREAILLTKTALEKNASARWIIGFSGGKDSTALLKVFTAAVQDAKTVPSRIDIIYCDTGVENPVLDDYVKGLFSRLGDEFKGQPTPFRLSLLRAPVKNRFFVKLIGRGYPPPTNSFRWCTKNLRIRPVAEFIKRAAVDDAIVALGMRKDESLQRDRTLARYGGGIWQNQNEGGRRYRMFLPILDLDVGDVWEAVFGLPFPESIDAAKLAQLYRGASGECPIVKAPQAAPCASGRFGCWTCTVVRKDRSSRSLIDAGHVTLSPYLAFRDWLASIRNDSWRRWPYRRNGTVGLGPFTLETRLEILRRLKDLEKQVGAVILPRAEQREIMRLWKLDSQATSRSVINAGEG